MGKELIPANEFQTAVPSSDGLLTVQSTNTESPSNNDLLSVYDLEVLRVPLTTFDYQALPPDSPLITVETPVTEIPTLLYTQGTCFNNMESASLIETLEELYIYLCDVLIRFDADPKHYQKEDYEALSRMLVGSLIYLYGKDHATNYYELNLGLPPVNGYVLASTTAGVRYWIPLEVTSIDPANNILEWNTSKYAAYSLKQLLDPNYAYFYTEDVVPTFESLLNLDGILRTTGLLSDSIYVTSGTPLDWLALDNAGKIISVPSPYSQTQLVSGTVTWLHDLVFQVSDCTYYIQGQLYNSPATQITLSPADPTNPRLDVIYVDIYSSAGFLTGDPANDPAKPIVDPAYQLELTSVLIPVNATEPADLGEAIVYNEGIEWTPSVAATFVGVTVNFADTTSPKLNTYQTRVTKLAAFGTSRIQYVNSIELYNALNSNLILSIRLSRAISTTASIIITLKSYSTQIGNTITIRNGQYGFNSALTSYQTLAIPFVAFAATSSNINTVQISFSGTYPTGTMSIDFDDIKFQGGFTTTVPPAYTLPIATNTVLGGIKIGSGLTIDPATGIVSAAGTYIVQTATNAPANAQILASLGTGIIKNTTTTGVLSIATGADLPVMTASVGGAVPTPPNNTTTFLRGDGTFAVPAGGGGITWTATTVDATMVVDNGYLANKGTLLTMTLPATSAVGKVVRIAGMNAGLWKIAQAAGQSINFGNQTTTVGTGGSLASVLTYDAVELVCIVANTTWMVISSVGNITIT